MHECISHPHVTKLTDLFLKSPGYIYVKRNAILLILLLIFFQVDMLAQQRITGKVLNDANVPLSGATVALESSKTTTLTSTDGSFIIEVKAGDLLEISYIGFKTQKIKPGAKTNLIIVLQPIFIGLDEVVATGYTIQRVKEITGSVAIVKPKDLPAVPAGQVEQMLQGRVAGLNVITSGEPGTASQIYLHGIGNFGNVTPLYIIDGVEGNINSLNPYDIESIQILKDAGAYSIYGVRGANGVIVVTTKKGSSTKTKISYDFYIGTTRPLKKGLDLLNPQEQADLEWQAAKNSRQIPSDPLYGNGPTPVLPDYLFAGPFVGLQNGDLRADPALYNIESTAGPIYQIVSFNKTGTDWFHQMFKPAKSQNHTLTVSGGSDKNHYLLSFGYLDLEGTYLNTYLKRFTTRVNTEFTVLNTIRIGENLQLSYSQNPRVGSIDPALSTFPFLPVYDIKGNSSSYGAAALSGYIPPSPSGNPFTARLLTKNDKDNNWQVFGNAYAEIDVLKKFTFRTSFGGPLNYYYSYSYNYGSYEPPPTGTLSSFSEQSSYANSWTWTNTLSYSGTFLENHQIKALIGTEEKNNYSRGLSASRMGYASNDPNYRFLNTGTPTSQTNSDIASASYLYSLIGQVNYSFKEKYFVSGTLRRDASSVFGPENGFGWFPALGIAWRMTEENFLKELKWITDLKLRASQGKTGYDGNTDPSNRYTLFGGGAGGAYYDIYGISSGNIQQGFRPVRIGNENTGWQQDVVTNIGLDAVFWTGKVSITADWYNKKSTGLLFPALLPALLGEAIPPNVNIGDVENTGIDLKLGSKGNFSKNWSWDALVTFSHYRNKIVKLDASPYFDDYPIGFNLLIRNEVGYPISSFYGYKVMGFFEDLADVAKSPTQEDAAPGRFKYLDANGDGKITTDDEVHFGNPNPKFTLGLNIGINYKNFDFSTFLYGSFGNDVFNVYRQATDIFFSSLFLTPKSKTALYNSWTPQHQDAKAPIQETSLNFSNAGVINSYALEKGSYFRNKNLAFGFSFPKRWVQKIKIERFRVYLQAVNLFSVTRYSGLDPELSGTLAATIFGKAGSSSAFGIDNFGNYPNNQKQYLIGLNIGF